jgi:hypothetical protein
MMTSPLAPVVFTEFEGNLDFYNDPRYRLANQLFYLAIKYLKECGMENNQACDWMRCWGYEDWCD